MALAEERLKWYLVRVQRSCVPLMGQSPDVDPTADVHSQTRRLIEPLNETPSDIDSLQQDILNIIGRDSIITPDDLRGNASTLQDALIGPGK